MMHFKDIPGVDRYGNIISKDFVPQVGDKIEITLIDGTVIVEVIDRITKYENINANENDPSTSRLLYRAPKKYKVGDTITGPELDTFPVGSVFTRINERGAALYTVVKTYRTYIYQDINSNHAWSNFTKNLKFRIDYIHGDNND